LLRQVDRAEQEGRQLVLFRLDRSPVVLAVLRGPTRLFARRLVGALLVAAGLVATRLVPALLVLLRPFGMLGARRFGDWGGSRVGSNGCRRCRLHRGDMVVEFLRTELVAA